MTKVKLCGLSRESDIAAVNKLKPDLVGFVFAKKSKRYVSPEQAAALKSLLAPGILAAGVFVNEPVEAVAELLDRGVIDPARLHGSEGDRLHRAPARADGQAHLPRVQGEKRSRPPRHRKLRRRPRAARLRRRHGQDIRLEPRPERAAALFPRRRARPRQCRGRHRRAAPLRRGRELRHRDGRCQGQKAKWRRSLPPRARRAKACRIRTGALACTADSTSPKR